MTDTATTAPATDDLEAALNHAIDALARFDYDAAYRRLKTANDLVDVTGATYIAVDAGGNRIARIGLDDTELATHYGNLVVTGYLVIAVTATNADIDLEAARS